ncbi:hypothetical protein [Sphingomonas crocodyli]|uniref:Uncharacterized protein n=1 Tax=Sphingomonas crocodyli TaxID=1979270 RepID=A0A437M0C1_9SPHN|nr:hypothetical protein [Sphingomonas crocodyli]RVT91149.1 hypothetical protein EOD43_16655 [Sphingomonas crocodyli]
MVVRQTRLIAALLLGTIVALAAGSVLWLGTDHPMAIGRQDMSAGRAAMTFVGYATFWSFAFDRATRVRRWRRNVLRAGGVLATSWIGLLVLVLALQMMALADAMGHPVDREAGYAAVIAILLLVKANLLPKSRPAWFNGVALPIFAGDPIVWRRVHRSSALRLALLGAATLLVTIVRPPGIEPLPIVLRLLMAELVIASLHGLWLTHRPRLRPLTP